MKITDALNAEHAVFLTQLGVLERMVGGGAPAGEIAACVLALAEAVEIHRKAEEDLLYPAILRVFGADFPPMRVMEAEHAQIERCVAAVRERRDVAESAGALVDVLRQHIDKEIHVLFPMAESRLSAAELDAMFTRAAAARRS
jgi:hemerythrin-like domain-containing protein